MNLTVFLYLQGGTHAYPPTKGISLMENKIPSWCYRGGSIRFDNKPGDWFKKPSGNYEGQWNRKELITYGKANDEYRVKYYSCPECNNQLLPIEQQYRFACSGCHLIFAYGFGGLYGFGKGHERAEYNEC